MSHWVELWSWPQFLRQRALVRRRAKGKQIGVTNETTWIEQATRVARTMRVCREIQAERQTSTDLGISAQSSFFACFVEGER
jgi:hypothetical protein